LQIIPYESLYIDTLDSPLRRRWSLRRSDKTFLVNSIEHFRLPQLNLYIRLFFAYTGPVFNIPRTRKCEFVVRCKACRENVPAPVETMPDTWILADCPLCGQKRRYLPTDIFRGSLSYRLNQRLVVWERRVDE
jgi:flavoprotein